MIDVFGQLFLYALLLLLLEERGVMLLVALRDGLLQVGIKFNDMV